MSDTIAHNIVLPNDALREFAVRWGVGSLALFGSVLRDDFGEGSDIDVLVSFQSGSQVDLFDLIEMKQELQQIFGRAVDLVEREALVNPYRREGILKNSRTIYAA